MKKALLLGPAPNLEQEIEKIKIHEFDFIGGINRIFHEKMNQIFKNNSIKLTHYYFSDFLYKREKTTIDNYKCKNKIIIAPFENMIPKVRSEIQICNQNVIDTINHIGGYKNTTWSTTGMFALGHLLYCENIDFVKICGFTFGEGKLHLYDDEKLDLSRHNVNKEKMIYNHFFKKNRCSC